MTSCVRLSNDISDFSCSLLHAKDNSIGTLRSPSLLFGGSTADVWIQPGELPTQGMAYRNKTDNLHDGSIALVLGAGLTNLLVFCD